MERSQNIFQGFDDRNFEIKWKDLTIFSKNLVELTKLIKNKSW